jgi:hypothetical protein
VRADCPEHELVTVGPGLSNALGACHTPGATDVLDHHLLPERLAHALRHNPAEDVGWAASRERDPMVIGRTGQSWADTAALQASVKVSAAIQRAIIVTSSFHP